MKTTLAERRAALGAAAVFSLEDAAELLPGRTAANRAWLLAQGIVLAHEGRRVVIWGDVIDAIRAGAGVADTAATLAPPRPRRAIPIASLPKPARLR